MSRSQRGAIDAFIVMDVMRAAHEREATGNDVYHLEVGQPGTPAPAAARSAAKAALDTDLIGYTDALGRPSLRARIAQHYADWYGLDIPAERIAVTTGSSAGFVLAFLASFDPGARLALPAPGYPCYRHIAKALGLEPVILETTAETRWMPTPEMLAQAGGLDGLLLASPANPTGTTLDDIRLAALARHCAEENIRFISDEIYHGLTYDRAATTALAHNDNAIIINSFSKYFSMTGWRVGWMVLPEDVLRPVERLMQNFFISAPTLSQIAAEAAFDAQSELEDYKSVYARNRSQMIDALLAMGLNTIIPPDGAFYIYADISHLTSDANAFAQRLLSEAGVATAPGNDFDEARGASFLRLSYARSEPHVRAALQRLGNWLSGVT
ncbi:MAG: aminotransferase class I/II-fold pyridoxal phosphate-dependent enzyme [Pseudomonadota bacterium]